MKKVKVKEVRELITPYPSCIGANAPITQVIEVLLRNPKTRTVYVVNKNRKLLGTINLGRTIKHIFPHLFEEDIMARGVLSNLGVKIAKDLIPHPPVYITDDDNLETAIKLMVENNLEDIPVVDADLKVVGELDLLEFLPVWLIKTQG